MNGDLFPMDAAAAEAAERVRLSAEAAGELAMQRIGAKCEFARRSVGQKVRWMREKREAR